MALQAYEVYQHTYGGFRHGYHLNEESMKELTGQALALSTLVLMKAAAEKPQRYVGDRRTLLAHKQNCKKVASLMEDQKEFFSTVKEATDQGYRSCVVCLLDGVQELLDAYIGNLNTGELHDPRCRWVGYIAKKNIEEISSARDALSRGYNGCYYCLKPYNTD